MIFLAIWGSLVALVYFFRKDILELFSSNRATLLHCFLALIPLVPGYYLLGPLRDFASKPEFLGVFLMLTGGILGLGHKVRVPSKKNMLRDSLLIGAMQSMALIPGISRSASTISCAQVLGWSPKEAVRFSFLLAIPTIIGGNLVEGMRLWNHGDMMQLLNLDCLIGFFSSFFTGLCIIRFAMKWLEKGKLKPFAWYCLIIGVMANVYLYIRL